MSAFALLDELSISPYTSHVEGMPSCVIKWALVLNRTQILHNWLASLIDKPAPAKLGILFLKLLSATCSYHEVDSECDLITALLLLIFFPEGDILWPYNSYQFLLLWWICLESYTIRSSILPSVRVEIFDIFLELEIA